MDVVQPNVVGGYKVPPCPLPQEQTPTNDVDNFLRTSERQLAFLSLQPNSEITTSIPSTFSTLTNLLSANQQWAKNMVQRKADFFKNLLRQQTPQLLWIGCSDSRVPANQIVNLEPGEVFVHRNISNIVLHADINCLSVLQYAVDVLKVKHVIVCGHYGCGGVISAMAQQQYGLIDNWLRAVKDIYHSNEEKLENLPDQKSKIDLMCEL
ncbi:hypothetical protein HMI54_012041, partial [Coelomomyces lativittatus]